MPTTVENADLAPLLDTPCFSCQTNYLTQSIIAPTDDLARRGLVSICATKCEACGDVRLYSELSSGAPRLELRAELDEMAAVLTEVACDALSDRRH
jgi:hypothetical protein